MKTYITSDLHFGHKNIMKFCSVSRARYDNDVQYMNETMIQEWNEVVGIEDLVYILGDVAFMSGSDAARIVNRLNGTKILIEGNHDRKVLLDSSFRNSFSEVHKYLDVIYNGTKVIMFHYPIAEWDQMHKGSVHFYGHCHGTFSGMEKYRCKDVGMDATGEIVISMDQAVAQALRGEIKGHH